MGATWGWLDQERQCVGGPRRHFTVISHFPPHPLGWNHLWFFSFFCVVRNCSLIGAVGLSHHTSASGQTPPSCPFVPQKWGFGDLCWSASSIIKRASSFAEIKGCCTRWQHCRNAAVDKGATCRRYQDGSELLTIPKNNQMCFLNNSLALKMSHPPTE